jgi:hypothetical protein
MVISIGYWRAPKGFTTAACLPIGIYARTQLAYGVFPLSACFSHFLPATALVFHVFYQIRPLVKVDKGDFEGRRDIIDNESWQNEGLTFDAQIDRFEPSTHHQRYESGNLKTLSDFRDSREGVERKPRNQGAASQKRRTPRSRASITSLVLMMPKSKTRPRPLPTRDATAFQGHYWPRL